MKNALIASVAHAMEKSNRITKIVLNHYCTEIKDSNLTELVSKVVESTQTVITYIRTRTEG